MGLGVIICFVEDDVDIFIQIQCVLANVCILGMFYMAICFIQNRESIKSLVEDIALFAKFSNFNMGEVDSTATFHAKILFVYAVGGMIIYSSTPLVAVDYCEAHKPRSMDEFGVPCTTPVRYRLPFRFDTFPTREVFAFHQFYTGALTTTVIATLTMLICGILMHIVNQLQQLRHYMLVMVNEKDDIDQAVHWTIEYHISIIEYLKKVNEAFGTQVILHFTLTSFVISVLGFEILMVGNMLESLRFTLHLAGWLLLLFLLCFYGQRLTDESYGVAVDTYAAVWYQCSAPIRRDICLIIARAQKPLTLNALYLGSMTHATFLKVLSSAYSYFTLLVNIRK